MNKMDRISEWENKNGTANETFYPVNPVYPVKILCVVASSRLCVETHGDTIE